MEGYTNYSNHSNHGKWEFKANGWCQMSGVKRFPVRLKDSFSEEIDWVIFHMNSASKNSTSKHQYILDAISEKMERDKDALKKKGIVYEKLGI